MTDSKEESRLYGWDDGKIYFSDGLTRKELCVNEEPELLERLVEVCGEWYAKGR